MDGITLHSAKGKNRLVLHDVPTSSWVAKRVVDATAVPTCSPTGPFCHLLTPVAIPHAVGSALTADVGMGSSDPGWGFGYGDEVFGGMPDGTRGRSEHDVVMEQVATMDVCFKDIAGWIRDRASLEHAYTRNPTWEYMRSVRCGSPYCSDDW